MPPFATVWEDFVEELADITAQGLDAEDLSTSAATYTHIFLIADALACSRFLKTLVKDRNLHRKGRADSREVEATFEQGSTICLWYHVPHRESQATLPDSPPLGHGHFHRHRSVCVRSLQ